MARNPYEVLGLTSSASDQDIRAAFRKLAKQYHPDRNPGDKKAEEKFKEVSAAFDILGDAEKRKKFDRGEIDAEGRERAYNPFGGGFGGAAGGYARGHPHSGAGGPGAGASFDDLGDIFADLFGARRAGAVRGRDLRYRLEVAFLEAARGATKRVTMPDGRALDLTIPAGLEDGQTLRLKGQGEAGEGGGPAGDVYVEVKVLPDQKFERKGRDIHTEVAIPLNVAVLGGKITAPTISGDVTVSVPAWSNSGAVLRLRGRGLKGEAGGGPGDQYVTLKIVLPDGGDAALEDFVRSWRGQNASGTRKTADA